AKQNRPTGMFGFDGSDRALIMRLWRDWMRRYLALILAAAAFMIVNAAVASSYPMLLKFAFDALESGGSNYPAFLAPLVSVAGNFTFYLLPVTIFAVTIIAGGANYFQAVLSNSYSEQTIRDLRNAIFGHVMRADLGMVQKDRSGALISRFITDLGLVRAALGKAQTGMVRDLLKVIFLAGVMIHLNWQLTLIVAVLFSVAARPSIRIAQRMRRAASSVQLEAAGLTSTLEQAFNAVRFIKAYGLEENQRAAAGRTFQRLYELRMKLAKGGARISPVWEVFGGLAFGGVLAFAGYQILSGTATLGEFTGFLLAVTLISQSLRSFGNLNVTLQEGLSAVRRVFELLDQKPQITDRPGAADLAVSPHRDREIRFHNVEFAYVPGAPAVRDLSFTVEPGQTVALVGPSGAGKSTILNLALRFYDVEKGSVTIDGQDVRDVSQASLRGEIALVSQHVTLFDDTVAANIRFGRTDATDGEVEAAAKAAAAHDFIMDLGDGYQTNVGERGMTLSGGERQRIAIARAMLKDAPILLLDEATSSLDAESELQVQKALERLAKGRTTVVIAHRLATVTGADRIFVLNEGRIVESGRHDDLRAAGGLYERLCKLQFRTDFAPVELPVNRQAQAEG
ncbi:MAG: ABC transporter ATP-binding protein, partial [Alphaproteobacteria bacterium]|nr:ABC transporter ATP-binding protein [Alphaproteobacteria bacterium]